MTRMTSTGTHIAAAALAILFLASGCLHSVRHELPEHTYFGQLPAAEGERRVAFEDSGMKNWALAGLLPYSSWSSSNMLAERNGAKRVENLEIETRFGRIDTIVWVVPGFFYGYYVWAPRTVSVSGTKVSEGPDYR
jgi:hypothetical protein